MILLVVIDRAKGKKTLEFLFVGMLSKEIYTST